MYTNNDSDYIEHKINQNRKLPEVGTVATVHTHTEVDDNSNHEVNVIINGEKEPRRVPILTGWNGMVNIPEPGDAVLVEYLDGDDTQPVVTGFAYTAPPDADNPDHDNRAPLGKKGLWSLRNSGLYLDFIPDNDAYPNGPRARLAKKPGDDKAPTTQVEIDDSGSTTEVNIETDGNVNINVSGDATIDAGGSVKVGDSAGTYKPVARKGDSVEVTLSDGSTGNGQITSGSSNVESS